MRRLVVALAVLGLAGGGVFGFAASAGATIDPLFTSAVTNLPIIGGTAGDASPDVEFGGQKDPSAVINDVTLDLTNDDGISTDTDELATCTGVAVGSGAWQCTAPPPRGAFAAQNNASIDIAETDPDGTVSQSVLTFDILSTPDVAPTPATTNPLPTSTVQFTPGGVNLKTSASSGASSAASEVDLIGDGPSDVADCPGDADLNPDDESEAPLGSSPTSPVTCSIDLSGYYDNLFLLTSQEGVGDEGDPTGEASYNFFGVMAPPVATTVATGAGDTATLTGTVDADYVNGGDLDYSTPFVAIDVVNGDGTVLCRTTDFTADTSNPPDPDGDYGDDGLYDWSCPITSSLGAGTHSLYAVAEDAGYYDGYYERDYTDDTNYYYIDGGLSPLSNVETVTFATAPATGGGGTTGDITPTWSFTIDGDTSDLHPGDTITIDGSGLPAGASIDTVLHSVPTDLGTVVAAADGTFTNTVTIPADIDPGAHTIIVTASGPGLVTTTQQQPITLVPIPQSGSGGKATTTTLPTTAQGSGFNANGTGTAIQPNILTRALTPFSDVAVHPNKIVSAIEIGLVLLLLAVLPAHLLNATFAEQSDRFERRFRRLRQPRWLGALVAWFRSAPVVAGITVTLATAILFGFADPKFGFTLASLRLILACGIALFLVGYVANALTAVIARNQWHIVVLVNTRPYGLALTVVGVLVSRLLHFSPGFLIGLILGLTIQGKSAAGFAWRTVVTRTCIVLAMSIAAWIGYSTLTLGGDEGGTFGTALLVETLVAIVTEGVVALLVELLPLRFLEGERVYAHSRVLWGILYVLTVIVFVVAVIPWEGNWDALGSSLWIWIVVLAVFAAICVGVYIYFRRFAKPLEEEAGSEEVSISETVANDKS